MENVLLALSLMSCIALIVSVMLQRSEGGALGMGGGGGGGLMSGRGAANTLIRATMVLAAIFFITSLALTRINADRSKSGSEITRTLEETNNSLVNDVLGDSEDLIVESTETLDPTITELSPNTNELGDNTDLPVSDGTEPEDKSAPKSESQ